MHEHIVEMTPAPAPLHFDQADDWASTEVVLLVVVAFVVAFVVVDGGLVVVVGTLVEIGLVVEAMVVVVVANRFSFLGVHLTQSPAEYGKILGK